MEKSEITIEEMVKYLSEKTYDVIHLDRCLIMQFKDAPDIKNPLSVEDYLNSVMSTFVESIYNYEKNMEIEQSPEILGGKK